MVDDTQNSPDVSRDVQLDVSRPRPPKSDGSPVRRRAPPPGRYLVRSGSSYLFQIRVPQVLAARGLPALLRVSLGPVNHAHARFLADILAAKARLQFDEMALCSMTKDKITASGSDTSVPGSEGSELEAADTSEEASHALAELKGIFQGITSTLKMVERARTDQQGSNPSQEALGTLIEINQQLAARDRGAPHVSAVTNHAALLRGQVHADLRQNLGLHKAVDGASPSVQASQTNVLAPSAVTVSAPAHPLDPTRPDIETFEEVEEEIEDAGPADPSEDWLLVEQEDRRSIKRRASTKPYFSVAARDYLQARVAAKSKENKDVKTANKRIKLFIELIGDHRIDTYTPRDLQSYINLLKYWPRLINDRPKAMSAHEIIAMNRDLHLQPMALKTLSDGYVAVVKSVFGHVCATHDVINPFFGYRLHYPDTARPPRPAEPLSRSRVSEIFRVGVRSGYMDKAILPLLGHLTGRRLGLLTFLRGSDIREKYEGVWVADTSGVLCDDGHWRAIGYKTEESMRFYVLHDLLREIGFIAWSQSIGDAPIFSELVRLVDPANSASSYMQRLFQDAGVQPGKREVFHSLRSNKIAEMQDNRELDSKTARLQAGHALGSDEHVLYGWKHLSEPRARQLAHMPLDQDIDYSPFKRLDFKRLAAKKRIAGTREKTA